MKARIGITLGVLLAGYALWLLLGGSSGVPSDRTGAAGTAHGGPEAAESPEPADEATRPGPGEVAVVAGERDTVVAVDEPSRETSAISEHAWGQVVDTFGDPVVGVMVHAFVPGYRGLGGEVIAKTETGRDGGWSLDIPRHREKIRIDFGREGYRRARRGGPFREMWVVLEPLRAARITGRLLSPSGAALSESELTFLFPQRDLDVAAPPFVSLSAVIAIPDRSLGQATVQREATVSADAAYSIQQPAFFAGEVVLCFRGHPVARRPWQDGDGGVDFEVDVAALKRGLGRLELTFEGAAVGGSDPIEVGIVRAAPIGGGEEIESYETETARLVVPGLTKGRYRIVARHAGGVGLGEATVPAGGAAATTIALTGRGRVRIDLTWPLGDRLQATEVYLVYRDAAGLEHELEQDARAADAEGSRVRVEVTAPAGPGTLVLDGNVLAVDLAVGENEAKVWELVRSSSVEIRTQVTEVARADRPRVAEYYLELSTAEGRVALARHDTASIEPDGWATVSANIPSGRYRVIIDWGELRRVEASIEAREGGVVRFPRD